MSGLACTSCTNSTPPNRTTVVLSRRIVIGSDVGSEEVRDAEAVAQICPDCQQGVRTEAINIECMMPPLLELERTTALSYLRRLTCGRELSQSVDLPAACTLCRLSIPTGAPYVDLSIATEGYGSQLISSDQPAIDVASTLGTGGEFDSYGAQIIRQASVMIFANICGPCSKEIWNIEANIGRLRPQGS